MAKGGKGRKGGGGGGGKTRKYSRDNNGRFASTGTGATARGGRLLAPKGNKRKTQTITAKGQKGVLAKPKGLKPGAIKPKAAAAKPAAKVDTSMKGITVRRARALAPRTSTYLSQKLNIQSAITKSAANAIYNRQRTVGKALGLNEAVVRNPIGIMPKISGSIRSRAAQLREAARKRVVGGRRR